MQPNSPLTPPPWQIRKLEAAYEGEETGWVLDGPPQPLGQGHFAKRSDAQMASAAPELCSSTETLYALLEALSPDSADPEVQRALSDAHAAIHKAKGSQAAAGAQAALI